LTPSPESLFNAAQQYFESAIHESPGYWKPYNNLGNLCLARGEKEKALSWYLQGLQKALPHDSSAMFIHMSLGTYYLKEEGNIEEARKHYALALPYVPYSLMMRQLRDELKL
jgi:tetratricopeptide (TPR) repeat protein